MTLIFTISPIRISYHERLNSRQTYRLINNLSCIHRLAMAIKFGPMKILAPLAISLDAI